MKPASDLYGRARRGSVRYVQPKARANSQLASLETRYDSDNALTIMATKGMTPILADSPESRRYNRIKRWLGVADFAIGSGLLVVLLAVASKHGFSWHV